MQHDIDKIFSITRSGLYLVSGREGNPPPPFLNFGLEVNYRVFFSVQCSDNNRAIASVWQRMGGGGKGGQMPSLNFESSYMYGPVVDLTFHLIEYDSNTVSLLLVSSY